MVWPSLGSPFCAIQRTLPVFESARKAWHRALTQNFAIGVGHAAVYEVAAGDGRRELVLLWRELAQHFARVIQIDRVLIVGICTFVVHHVSDDERLPFVASRRACGHGPRNAQFRSVWALIWLKLLCRVPW